MAYFVHRLVALSRTIVAGPFQLQSDADTCRAGLTVNDRGTVYEVVSESGVGDGAAIDASMAAAVGNDTTVSTAFDVLPPDVSTDVTRDPVSIP